MLKDRIPKQVFKGIEMCRLNGINIAVGNEVTLPNCTNFSWTVDNITSKDIRLALLKVNLIDNPDDKDQPIGLICFKFTTYK